MGKILNKICQQCISHFKPHSTLPGVECEDKFSSPQVSGVPHLPGVPHRHVNRPLTVAQLAAFLKIFAVTHLAFQRQTSG